MSVREAQVLVDDTYTEKPYIRPKLKVVPKWMYEKSEDVFCGLWTLPSFMWTINFVAFIFHSVLILVTCLVSTSGGKGLDTPTLTIYKRKTVWNGGVNGTMMNNATSIFTPSLVEAGWKLPLTYVTIVFFGLSAFFHGFICLMNFSQSFAHDEPENRKITMFTGWYFKFLHDCRQPLRWIECECIHYSSPPCSPSSSPAHGPTSGMGLRYWDVLVFVPTPSSTTNLERICCLSSSSISAFSFPTWIPQILPAKNANTAVMDTHGKTADAT